MILYYFIKKWKWFYGLYAHSGIRVQLKTKKIDKFEKGLHLPKIAAQSQRLFFPRMLKIIEIDNSEMRCKCYTRYKSNADTQIW